VATSEETVVTHQDADLAHRPCRHPYSSFRRIGDHGGLVVLPGKAEVKVLNPVGVKIFSLLDGKHTVDEIAASIVEEFEVTPEEAVSDVRDFLGELSEHGMLAE
jgi:hypothetical protein